MGAWTPLQWGCAFTLAGLLLGAWGLVINDEQEQILGLYNLANGSFLIEERPEWIYPKTANVTKELRHKGEDPQQSVALNFIALPFVPIVHAADAVAPLGAWAALAAVALAWPLLPPRLRGRPPPVWSLVAFVALANGFRIPEPDVGTYAPLIALQVTNLLALGLAAGFLAAAIKRRAPGPAGSVAVLAVVLGPMLYWGSKIKYTVLTMALLSMALWVAGEAPSRRRAMALGALAGLLVWTNLGPGLPLAAATGLLLLMEAWRARHREARQALVRLGAGAAAGAASLSAWMAGNLVISGNPFVSSKLVIEGRHLAKEGQADAPFLVKVWHLMVPPGQGLDDWLLRMLDAWTLGVKVEGPAIGVFALSPLLLLSFWTVARTRWWQRPDLAVAACVVALHVVLFTNRVVGQGWGWDVRLLAPVLPAVGLLAAPSIYQAIAWMGGDEVRASVARALAIATLLVSALLAIALGSWRYALRGAEEPLHDAFVVLIFAMLALAAAVSLAAWARLVPRRPATVWAVGFLLAIPAAWTGVATLATPTGLPADDGGSVTGFVPLVDRMRQAATSHMYPPYPMPTIHENNETVYHPDYGYCRQVPSPCPWVTGDPGSTTG